MRIHSRTSAWLARFIVPATLVFLTCLARFDEAGADPAIHALLAYAPYAIFLGGIAFCLLFNRGRPLLAIALLAVAYGALESLGVRYGAQEASLIHSYRALEQAGRLVFQALGFFLPIDFAWLAFRTERGIVSRRGILFPLFLLAQIAATAFFCFYNPGQALIWMQTRLFPFEFAFAMPLEHPARLSLALSLAVALFRAIRANAPIEDSFAWALAASFLGFQFDPLFFATGGLLVSIGMVGASRSMAFHDDLTGLPARRALNDALLALGGRYAIAMLDVDRFKKFNDTYGHDVGDQALRMVASNIAAVGGGGKPFRYGGEEFAVIFPGRSANQAIPHLQAVRSNIANTGFYLRSPDRPERKPEGPIEPPEDPQVIAVTISIGVAEPEAPGATPDDVLKAADQALYRAKHGGRNRVSR